MSHGGLIIKLPNGGEIEIHCNEEGDLSEVTLNGKGGIISRDIHFGKDGKIFADGKEI